MDYVVYILYSANSDKYYIGHTRDLNTRIAQHNIRKKSCSNDWKLVYKEHFLSRSEAMKREKEIKGKKRRVYIESLITSLIERPAYAGR